MFTLAKRLQLLMKRLHFTLIVDVKVCVML